VIRRVDDRTGARIHGDCRSVVVPTIDRVRVMTRCGFFASSIAFAVAVALPGSTHAQIKPGVVVPHAAPTAPRPAAPVAPAPHVSAPQAAFVPHAVAPRIATPNGTAHIATPHVAAPHLATPRMATPRANTFAARPIGQPLARHLDRPRYRGTTFAHTSQSLGRAAQRHGRGALTQRLDTGRSTARSSSRHQVVGRGVAPTGPDRPSRQTGSRSRTNNVVARPGFHGRFVHHDGPHDWTRFAGRDRDRARRRFHAGFVGWAGPVFWPYADDDIVDATVWPYDYGEVFWSYGPEDLVEAVFWPYAADENAEGPRRATSRRSRRHSARQGAGRADFSATCGAEGASGIADWPISQIEQAVQPTDQQRAALDELKAASAEASKVIRAACPRQLPATPAGRLAVMENRLEAMRNAVDIVRPALDKFYDSLSDEQKARFNALAAPQNDADKSALARACAEQASHVAQWPVDQVERAVRPTAAQRQSFDDLRAAVTQAADAVKASCPSTLPATPPGRLDAVRQRIDAMHAAAAMIRDKLERFYGTLSDEQKARFNAIGSAASRSES
jgi:LTXXQ motif family protein